MSGSKLGMLREMAAKFPSDPRARYFLAHELFKAEDWAGAAEHYRAYVELAPGDVGAGLKNLGLSLERLGRTVEAADAYRRGIQAALSHQHEGLASEIRFLLECLEG